MVTNSMTHIEVFNNILSDRKNFVYWIEKNKPKVLKAFSKQFKFPKYQIIDYEHQNSKNKYLLFFGLQNRESSLETKVFLVYCYENEKYFIDFGFSPKYDDTRKEHIAYPILSIYTSHFFKRYKERFLNDETLTIKDVIGNYFSRLTNINLLNINDNIINDYKGKYGEFTFAALTNNGLCLGERRVYKTELPCEKDKANEVAVNIFRTFVSKDLLTKKQKDALFREELEYFDRYMEYNFKRLYLART